MKKILEVSNVAKHFKVSNGDSYNTLSSTILSIGKKGNSRKNTQIVEALKDISFDMHSGEILGLIGRNGAGKSTLLRVISGITTPTKGKVNLNGSVAAILEVGAGFHPEMTGRENARLNGAILGLSTATVNQRMDEIIEFADLQSFIDTPIKKYSSGMRSRLGFAVASLLEPDLLIVDEALAVGDIAFQQKSLGKMQEMANSGRSVILVSHQPTHVRNLCTRALWIENGIVKLNSDVATTLSAYQNELLKVNNKQELFRHYETADLNEKEIFRLLDYKFRQNGAELANEFAIENELIIELKFEIFKKVPGLRIFIDCQDSYGGLVFRTFADENAIFLADPDPGKYSLSVSVPGGLLAQTQYSFSIESAIHNVRRLLPSNHFRQTMMGIGRLKVNPAFSGDSEKGIISPNVQWDVSYKHAIN